MLYQGLSVFSRLSEHSQRLCSCYNIEPDWENADYDHYLTDHDSALIINNVVFEPMGFGAAKSLSSSLGLNPSTTSALGVLQSDKIKDEDIKRGIYDGATITHRIVDWKYPWAGAVEENVFTIGKITFDSEYWSVELNGLIHKLEKTVGVVTSKMCRYIYGGSEFCRATQGSTATTVTTGGYKNKVRATGLNQADTYYKNSMLKWTSGDNKNLKSYIKSWDNVNKWLVFYNELPFAATTGDGFTIYQKCNRAFSDCVIYGNSGNFGGEQEIIGTNELIKGVDTI